MHWYVLSKKSGIAALCTSESDARKAAQEYDKAWPNAAPHVATRLQPIDADDGIDIAEELRNVLRWEEKRMGAVSAGALKEVIERLEKMLVPTNCLYRLTRIDGDRLIPPPNPTT